jgi:N4-gp56 family major capsid protein
MADSKTGVTETVATKQDVVSAIVQKELIQSSILIPTVTDLTPWVKKGATQVTAPRAGSFTVQDKAENTGTDWQSITFAGDALLLDKYKHIPALLEDIAQMQAAVDVEGEYIRRMASAMALQMDVDLIVQLKLCSASSPDHIRALGNSGAGITVANILEARKLLNQQNVPQSERFLVISPAQESYMLAIDNFVSAEKYGSSQPVMNAELGRVFGFTVLMHNSLSDAEALAYHKSHAAFARQQDPRFERQRASLKELGDELSLSTLYGCKVMDSGKRGVFFNDDGTVP